MADTTTRYSWPYPELTDAPDGPALGQDLAEAAEVTVGGIDDRVTTAEGAITTLQGRTTGKPLVVLRHSAVQAVANNGGVLTWDTEDADTTNIHSTGTNPSRVTPTLAGWYRITFTVHWAGNATGRRAAATRINGTTVRYGEIKAATSAATVSATVTMTLPFNGTGDYVEAWAFQDSGGALNTADTVGTRFEVAYERPL